MPNTSNSPQYVTKQDLDDRLDNLYVRIEKMVGNTVGEIVGDALQIISERFDKVDKKFEEHDRHFEAVDKRFDRLEDKMDTAAATVDHHAIDIRELQRKTA